MGPTHIGALRWQQSCDYARQICARFFRDGCAPSDALTAFGLTARETVGWAVAVDRIALALCAAPLRKVA
jgi:hypothetical protein